MKKSRQAEGTRDRGGQPGEKFAGEQVALGLKLDLLSSVDGLEGRLNRLGVIGAVGASAGKIGDLDEGALVEIGGHASVADLVAGLVKYRKGHETITARADRVDRNATALGDRGGLEGGEGATVVGSIGEQHGKGALALSALAARGLFKPGEGEAQSIADRGAIFDQSDLEALDLTAEPVVVKGKRRQCVGAAGKHDDADTITGTFRDERLNDGLDRLETVDARVARFVVLGEHRSGKVDREHDVVAFSADFALVLHALGTCERDNQKNHADQREAGGPAGRRGERRPVPGGGKGHQQDGHGASAAQP